jgi:hypothetical protein
MRRRRIRSAKSARSPGIITAVAVFAILCGAIVFAGTFNRVGSSSEPAPELRGPDRRDVTRAIQHLDQASNALEATDYGRTRFHLRESQRALADSLEVARKGE